MLCHVARGGLRGTSIASLFSMTASPISDRDTSLFGPPGDGAGLGRVESLRPGARVSLGENDELVLIRQGRLLASTLLESGGYGVTLLRGAGNIIGLERLHGQVHTYEIVALTHAEVSLVGANELYEHVRGRPERLEALLERALDAVALCIAERIALRGSALQRVARFMLDAGGHDRAALALPKNAVARLLQIRPETLSRVLKKLETAGAIAVRQQTQLVDVSKLAELADGA